MSPKPVSSHSPPTTTRRPSSFLLPLTNRPLLPLSSLLQISLTLIVAATTTNGIGASSTLPWRLPKEMAYFARVTKATGTAGEGEGMNAVVMGRKTWEGIPSRFRPLPERVNVVVSRQVGFDL